MAPPFTQPHIEPSPRRIRILFAGTYIVDTQRSKLVWLKPYYPTYFFESADVPMRYLKEVSKSADVQTYDVVVGERKAEAAATEHLAGDLEGLIEIKFGAMDAWFEEEEQVFVHPKDPYKRVDVLQSSRHVRVEVNGVEVANTRKPRLLFETSLPVRTYIPKTDCRMDLLVSSDLTTSCPYKGTANYYSVKTPSGETFKDIAWWYHVPLPECADIKGFIAFYDEKVDVWVDGVHQKRPNSIWS
ncbi:uncharacterized protein FIBRA_06413 [Fibroporia radiculosa]|uniref:DUF427 domain-containing protein n=1 Tax=Fibroporia radiculosa TaxID=599839 RepID=J4IB90_9APHY|nr:uncharacterized protein FIBRA_06413 [Fibroporia radiculosa]CCM04246.1 predicted protein [Fibroporia radiculosa]